MIFNAHYIHPRHEEKQPYWRTVSADGINEASKEAEKYRRKGYIIAKVVEKV